MPSSTRYQRQPWVTACQFVGYRFLLPSDSVGINGRASTSALTVSAHAHVAFARRTGTAIPATLRRRIAAYRRRLKTWPPTKFTRADFVVFQIRQVARKLAPVAKAGRVRTGSTHLANLAAAEYSPVSQWLRQARRPKWHRPARRQRSHQKGLLAAILTGSSRDHRCGVVTGGLDLRHASLTASAHAYTKAALKKGPVDGIARY